MTRVIIAGSRDFSNVLLFRSTIKKYLSDIEDKLGRVRYLEEYPIVAEGFLMGIDDVKNCQLYLDV